MNIFKFNLVAVVLLILVDESDSGVTLETVFSGLISSLISGIGRRSLEDRCTDSPTRNNKCNLVEEFSITIDNLINRFADPHQQRNYAGCVEEIIMGYKSWQNKECRGECVKIITSIPELKSCDEAMKNSEFDRYARNLNISVRHAQIVEILTDAGIDAKDACELLRKFNENADEKSEEEYFKIYNTIIKVVGSKIQPHSKRKIDEIVTDCMHDFTEYMGKFYFQGVRKMN